MTKDNGSNRSGGGRMTPAAASRIQSATTKANGGATPAKSFAARAQSAASGSAGKK